MPSYDVDVRIPRAGLSLSVLKKLQVSLYRVKEEVKSPISDNYSAINLTRNFVK
jgi:hypothetical protein